jgi:hypothetical protein
VLRAGASNCHARERHFPEVEIHVLAFPEHGRFRESADCLGARRLFSGRRDNMHRDQDRRGLSFCYAVSKAFGIVRIRASTPPPCKRFYRRKRPPTFFINDQSDQVSDAFEDVLVR